MPKNYYLILGVGSNATPGEIKSAFRQRAKELHPDRSGMESTPFREVQEAYAVLSDDLRRLRYDRETRETRARKTLGEAEPLIPHTPSWAAEVVDLSLARSFAQHRPSFEELFARLWSNFERDDRPKAERIESLTVEVELTPEMARRGGRIRVWLPAVTSCGFCGGRGGIGGYICPRCAGAGVSAGEHPVEIEYPPVAHGFVRQLPLAELGIQNLYLALHFRVR